MHFNRSFKIGNRRISDVDPVFIIAEAGVNHNGDIKKAKMLIDIAVNAGADAVKFQHFKTDNLILRNVNKAQYQLKTTSSDETQYQMLKKLEITLEQNLELFDYCNKQNIIFLTTPFDEESLDELDELNVAAYKIASTDLTNINFLKRVATKGKPIFLSTGMSYLAEIEIALNSLLKINKDVVLLQCTANYPIKDADVNLNVIKTFQNNFDIIIGYSDHSTGIGAAPYSIPMGAKVIEKHFTSDKDMKGPDHQASLTPDELKVFVNTIRKVESYMGSFSKYPTMDEVETRKALQKCIVASKDIYEGEIITSDKIVAKRTGGIGISAFYFEHIIGKQAKRTYSKDEIIDAL